MKCEKAKVNPSKARGLLKSKEKKGTKLGDRSEWKYITFIIIVSDFNSPNKR